MSSVVNAYLRLYTPPQLESALRTALEDYASGKTITSINFEGESTSAAIRGEPERIISILETCLEIIDSGGTKSPASSVTATDFSRRICTV